MQSIGIDRTQAVRPDYDPEAARLTVFGRWQKDRRISGKIKMSDPEQARAVPSDGIAQ